MDALPKNTRFTLAGRMSNLGVDILELIIRAIYSKEKRALLTEINMKLEMLRIFSRLIMDRKYISIQQYEYLANEFNTAGKMTGGWLKECKE